MAIQRLGRGACEYLPHLKLLLSYWPVAEFLDEEWDGYVAEIMRHSHATPGFRALTWNARNAAPRPAQQMRLSQVAGGSTHRGAIVMQQKPHGFANAVLAFVNPNIQTFSQDDWDAAWAHLDLTPLERREAEQALNHLRDAALQSLRHTLDRGHDVPHKAAITYEAKGFVFASYLNVGIAIFSEKMPAQLVQELRPITLELARQHKLTSTIYIPVDGMPMPDAQARDALQKLASELSDDIIAIAQVISGDDLWASAVRGLATSLQWVNRTKYKVKAFSTVAEATAWLAPIHSARSHAIDPDDLAREIARLLARPSLHAAEG
jgi:hypothetical protein